MDGMSADAGGDEDSSSSSPEEEQQLECQLDQFREQWRQELRSSSPTPSQPSHGLVRIPYGATNTKEDKARQLFLQGVQAERCGAFNQAVYFYRRAIQLVPDIESKIEYQVDCTRERQESESSVESTSEPMTLMDETVDEEDDDETDIGDLIGRFHRLKVRERSLCLPNYEPLGAHISDLPAELLVYIFKWVISGDLDLRAFDQLGEVCRGFYLLSRDEELWKLACKRIWGVNTGRLTEFDCWRSMFLLRPHLHFHGCYISRMSYLRHGEPGLDSFYKPVHVVEYYRYFRFFSDGSCLMMTTPEEPSLALSRFRQFNVNEFSAGSQGILHGYYRLAGNVMTAVMRRNREKNVMNNRFRRHRQNNNRDESEQDFHIEMTIKSSGKKLNCILMWTHYSLSNRNKQTGEENVTEFTLSQKMYPPMCFSRVKSYTTYTDSILQ